MMKQRRKESKLILYSKNDIANLLYTCAIVFTFFVSLYPRRIFNIQNTCIALCDVTIMLDSFVRFILYIEIYIDIREQILDRFHDAAKKMFYCVLSNN